ncbi:hypothetical protein SAY86_006997 [Trapa natans]|uniref:Uncharacterized protein n=1 Tax=Trapa natans TaxID=22666 RepID=A0AAN7L7F6_TRANT|nr:hypothetical protein SAY86_006997 [Trapa natans]
MQTRQGFSDLAELTLDDLGQHLIQILICHLPLCDLIYLKKFILLLKFYIINAVRRKRLNVILL